jgi:pyruvate dehydrogenase E2 component (dihydrolipoamide acetyltransferase)
LAIEKITVPDLGDAADVEIIELLVAVGDTVAENDSLMVLESDKAAMEIPAPIAGVVKSIAVNLGDQVNSGSEILSLEVEGAASAEDAKPEASEPEQPAASKTEPAESETQQQPEPSAEAPSSASAQSEESVVKVPDLGTDDEVDVIEIHVSEGDNISADDPLITLESDKAAMEVPAPQDGEVLELLIKVGDKVKTGSDVIRISGAGAAASPSSAPSSNDAAVVASSAPEAPATALSPGSGCDTESTCAKCRTIGQGLCRPRGSQTSEGARGGSRPGARHWRKVTGRKGRYPRVCEGSNQQSSCGSRHIDNSCSRR